MPFISTDQLKQVELFPQAVSGIVAGENIMLSFLELEQDCVIPEHSHPHEQAGLILSGKLRFRIAEEERVVGAGDAFLIPKNLVHSGLVIEGPVKVLDIFSPLRKDYLDAYNQYSQTSEKTVWRS
jgi:quercetin dioxygenase-like cupin family protein